MKKLATALLLAALASACRSVEITPASIDVASVPAEERSTARERWGEAVALTNEFLASPYRRTLPAGHFDLDARGMRYVTERGTWPIEVRCTCFGDLVVGTGYRAQEREYGFVVGRRPPKRDPRVDNSMFRDPDGELHDVQSIADLMLHETTHVVYREGTVGFWNGLAYYLEAIFLLRSASHSAERRPHATSEEFGFFNYARNGPAAERDTWLEFLDRHIAEGPGKNCRHGPQGEEPRPPR